MERLLRRAREQPEVGQPVRQDGHPGAVELAEPGARPQRRDTGRLGIVDEGVQVALQRREPSGHRKRARDVGGVELAVLRTHVEEQQLPRTHRAVVVDPVQGGCMRPARDDGAVAHVVALEPGAAPERSLDPALTELDGAWHVRNHIGEASFGDRHRVLELFDLPRVLDQPELRQRRRKLGVTGVVRRRDRRVDGGVDAAPYARRDVAAQHAVELVDVPGLQAVRPGHLGKRGAAPGPQLAVHAVAPELVAGGTVRARAQVQNGVVAAGAVRLEHQHRIGGL